MLCSCRNKISGSSAIAVLHAGRRWGGKKTVSSSIGYRSDIDWSVHWLWEPNGAGEILQHGACTWQAMYFPVKMSQGRTGGSSQLFPRSEVADCNDHTSRWKERDPLRLGDINHYTKHSGLTISTKILRFFIWTVTGLDGRGHSSFWTLSYTSDSKDFFLQPNINCGTKHHGKKQCCPSLHCAGVLLVHASMLGTFSSSATNFAMSLNCLVLKNWKRISWG